MTLATLRKTTVVGVLLVVTATILQAQAPVRRSAPDWQQLKP
jgi:hypothetical protein